MFVPFVSSPSKKRSKQLYRRKGGGGRGGGGGSSGGGKAGSSGSGGGGRAPVSTGGSTKPATSYGGGGGKAAPIPAGQLFAGRTVGGGTRDQVYGNKQYGSGYPGVAGRGVAGRGFPFVFWPLAWGGLAGAGAGVYLHNSEYGRPNNGSRPGGPMVTAAFISSSQNTTFRVLADNATVTELITDIRSNCSGSLSSSSSSSPSTYEDSLSALPQPEQAVQYYRASSVALTLDGYNNTGALGPEGAPDTPIPTNIDQNLLNCLNQTIGEAVPLIDGAARWSASNLGIFGLFWALWYLSYLV